MGITVLAIVEIALFGLPGLAIWALQMILMPFSAAGVNQRPRPLVGLPQLRHRRHAATNLTPWGLLIGGEDCTTPTTPSPSSAKFALRKFEFDIRLGVLWTLAKLRLATILRTAPRLNVRPNISVPDADTMKAVMVHRWQVGPPRD
jgi:stearoyl-CoA desaturase (delta-9 desaturase)